MTKVYSPGKASGLGTGARHSLALTDVSTVQRKAFFQEIGVSFGALFVPARTRRGLVSRQPNQEVDIEIPDIQKALGKPLKSLAPHHDPKPSN